jgi:TRAP-type C4-dicarboxylate transport system permease large subunit
MVELAAITPPLGLNVYVIGGIAKDVPMHTIFRGVLPFILGILLMVALLLLLPQIATFLPTLLY